MRNTVDDPYVVKSVVQAASVLDAFQSPGELLRLRDIVTRTGLQKATAFRLLHTLHQLGFITKAGDNVFRLETTRGHKKKHVIGFAMNGRDTGFTRIVTNSLRLAADEAGIELLVLDNRNEPRTTLRNADVLVKNRVDLAIEFQGEVAICQTLSTKFLAAGIPMIAVDVPHPGATYYGANNYEAGLIAGRWMAKWARTHWQGEVDQIVLMDYVSAGVLPHARLKGILNELLAALPASSMRFVFYLDGSGDYAVSLEAMRRHLREGVAQRVLVGSVNDSSALASLRAFEEAGRINSCAVMGQGAEPDARTELRRPGTRFIGSVAYFPENYGTGILRLANQILGRGNAAPAVFVKHHLITPENVDHFYPNDAIVAAHSG